MAHSLRLIPFALLIFVLALFFAELPIVFSDDVKDVNTVNSANNNPSTSSDMRFEDELAWLREENYVNIATKSPQKASEAPSIITVITEEEISNLGARRLTDILAVVPGFDIIKMGGSGKVVYGARGKQGVNQGAKIKVLIDGHSLNVPHDGDTVYFFDDLPLKNVKKIEIIRGPGSALYGANAFLAVVNIITKKADEIDGIDVASGFGSFDTQEYNILFGKTVNEVGITGFANFYNTNGMNATIDADLFTGTPFATTPGRVDDSRNNLNTQLNLSYKGIQFGGKYMNKDTEPFIGSNFILTDDGENRFNYAMADLGYKWEIGEKMTVKPRAYYDQYDIEFMVEPFPDGFIIPQDLDGDGNFEDFPDGMIADGLATNRRLGSDIQTDYTLLDNNTFTFGFGYEWERQDNVEFNANFDPLTSASIGEIQSLDTDWIREVVRQIWSVYIQDKWDITDDLGLTIGIRHDHYSDFEGTTNPRIGLVWDFMEDATLKLLYGQAFRAPAFNELYLTNNPVLIGNPDLRPETVRTYEVGLGYRFTKDISADVNYFFNAIRDEIGIGAPPTANTPAAFENLGAPNIQGIEFELKANLWKGSYVFGNYTYLDAEAKGDPEPDVPKHKGNVGINVGMWKYLNANLHTFISDDRARGEADPRDDSPGYAILNLTLIAKEFFRDMQVKASLFNLLDKDYTDPAPIGTIPNDLPRPGRTFFVGLEYGF